MEQSATTLSCPKDGSPMRTYERNGVVIDRCTECGGIFLDRGELERLMDAEGSYNEERGWGGDERWEDDDPRRRGRRRRGGFLGDLLDFG
ncbi:MAG: hypothetical protein DLM71_03010 [Chloroflexi bacterium]|nr:MAG: hypothetical protein DLM71_03010 [Chloroflexota bacterium]